ncbi:hypothetical protein [Peribacillus simplex]|uniref:hypothetical protein n=1 Tax=Peribacillus simplex TaxID=1478 RepID=UPI0028533C61|nr:hypothetical protein [Peribacillus simplex]MDR4926538.1 hypothetical protein [Peribacillus simplex]
MNNNELVSIACQYREILFSLIEALDENKLSPLTDVVKSDVCKVDMKAKALPQLSILF